MRSKTADRIRKDTPEEVKDFVRLNTDNKILLDELKRCNDLLFRIVLNHILSDSVNAEIIDQQRRIFELTPTP